LGGRACDIEGIADLVEPVLEEVTAGVSHDDEPLALSGRRRSKFGRRSVISLHPSLTTLRGFQDGSPGPSLSRGPPTSATIEVMTADEARMFDRTRCSAVASGRLGISGVFGSDFYRHIQDLLAGRVPPPIEAESGRGLLMVNFLCDLVQVKTGPSGTAIRLWMTLPAQ